MAGASCLQRPVRAAPARPGGRKSGLSRDASRSGVFLPSEPSGSSHIPAPSTIVCLWSLVDLLGGAWGPTWIVGHFASGLVPGLCYYKLLSGYRAGVVVRRLGNVTTSYTVMYSSNPVGVGCCLAVLQRRALSCLPGGWCRVLVALSVAVLGYSGLSDRPFSRVLAFLSSFPFVRTPSSLTRQSLVCRI